MTIPKIKDCLPLANGLWEHIDYDFPEDFNITSSQLDIIFLSNWSQRLSAPVLKLVHNGDGSMLTDSELTTLAGLINGMYKHRWDKLFSVAVAEYNPIHNYYDNLEETIQYTEEEDNSKSKSGSTSSSGTDNYTDTRTDNRTVGEIRNNSNTGSSGTDNGVYGFNSSSSVGATDDSSSYSDSESGSTTTTYTGTVTNAHTESQSNTGSSSETESGSNDTIGERTRNYTKTGNIGNISTQKLLKEELELWQYNFVYEIMRDVINFISLPVYETDTY